MKKVIYVSNNGFHNDTGEMPERSQGLCNGPIGFDFNRFKDIVLNDINRGLIFNYEFIFREGTYYFNKPVVFMPHNGGSIKFMAYENEKVIFSGGKKIEGLKEETVMGKRMFTVYIPEVEFGDWNFKELYVNKKPAKRTLYPQNGFFRLASTPGNPLDGDWFKGTNFFEVRPEDWKNVDNPEDTDVIVTHYWVNERMNVKEYNKEKNIVSCEQESVFQLRNDIINDYANYRIENVFCALENEGEWYLNRKNGKLYYIPREGETIDNVIIEAPILNKIFEYRGENKPVRGISFEKIIFECISTLHTGARPERTAHMFFDPNIKYASDVQAAMSVKGAIVLQYSEECKFINCIIRNFGGYGIQIGNGCSRNIISNCEIYNGGAGAIRIDGGDSYEDESLVSGYNEIIKNTIYDCSISFYSAAGIFVMNAFSNHIAHNEIYNLRYSGISCGWVWGYGKSRACSNIIEYNHIYNLGDGTMSDMGGIYMLGPQGGSEIRGNIIHDVCSANYGGWGIYLDEGSSNIVVEKNLVYNTDSEPFFIHYGRENVIRYNIFIGIKAAAVGIGKLSEYNTATIIQNVLVFDKNSTIGRTGKCFDGKSIIFDCNYYHSISNNDPIIKTGTPENMFKEYSWSVWKDLGYDCNSRIVGDIFESDGITLKADSVVFKHGFRQ